MSNGTIAKLHDMVEKINKLSLEDDKVAIDASKSMEGLRIWRIGRQGKLYADMSGPDRSTAQMKAYLEGVLDRQQALQGRVGIATPVDVLSEPSTSGEDAGRAGVWYLPSYVDKDGTMFIFDDVLTDDEATALQVSGHDLEPDSYHMVELQMLDGSHYISNIRVMSPFEIDWSIYTTFEATSLVVPSFDNSDGGIFYPAVNPSYKMDQALGLLLEFMAEESMRTPQKAIISGEPATGKTSGVQQFAARNGRPVFQMTCGLIESSPEFIGIRTVDDEGKIEYRPSGLIRALQTPDCVIILDEFNRLHPTHQNSLYNILDDFGQSFVGFEFDKNVRVASGVMIIATMNIGAKHTGTFQLDDAMADRFPYHIKLDYLNESDEVEVLVQRTGIDADRARKLVEIANQTRALASDPDNDSAIEDSISLRQLLAMSTMVARGIGVIQAASFSVFNDYSSEGGEASAQAAVRELFQGKFG